MTELFSDIDIEVLIDGTWISLWDDVLHSQGIKASRGIMSNGIEDRVADAGALTFSLNNSAENSARLIGYYSPGHANCLSGWTIGLPVRVKFSYDTWTRYKWFGYIDLNGIRVMPGTQSERRVVVTCVDFMGIASRHKMNLMNYRQNLYLDEAMKAVLANMPVQPKAIDFNTFSPDNASVVLTPFPLVFDLASPDTTAIAEFHKLATGVTPVTSQPGRGSVTIVGDGLYGETLFASFQGSSKFLPRPTSLADKVIRQDNSDFILLQSGDFLLREGGNSGAEEGDEIANFNDNDILPGSEFSYGKDITNYVTVVSYPRRVGPDATTVLWTLENTTEIEAGATITLRAPYNDPDTGRPINAIEFTTPVANTDYKANSAEDGSGSDRTSSLSVIANFGAAEAELKLSNTGGSTLYTGGTALATVFQIRGKGVYIDDTARQIATDPASMQLYGVQPLTIDSKYMDLSNVLTPSGLDTYAESVVALWKDPRISIDRLALLANKDAKNMTHFMFLESRDVVQITESVNGLSAAPYRIQGYDFEIVDGQYVFWNVVFKLT